MFYLVSGEKWLTTFCDLCQESLNFWARPRIVVEIFINFGGIFMFLEMFGGENNLKLSDFTMMKLIKSRVDVHNFNRLILLSGA